MLKNSKQKLGLALVSDQKKIEALYCSVAQTSPGKFGSKFKK